MEVTIINPASSTLNMGTRLLSSAIKSRGYSTKLVFLNKMPDEEIDRKMLNQLLKICRNSDLIAISLMTMDFRRAVEITQFLKKHTNKLVAWGGIHPTLCPEECIKHIDVVCVGDGEDFMLELLEKLKKRQDYTNLKGGWFRKKGKIIKNPVREINQNLDEFPPMDVDPKDKWFVKDGELVPMRYEEQKKQFETNFLALKNNETCYCYTTQATRGCPHRCAYCSNAMFLDIFKGKGKMLRRRSVKSIIKELEEVKRQHPYINAFNFYDDTFFAATDDEIEEFAREYKKKIKTPFFCLASPVTLSERKLKALIDAGMGHIQMGVQTGSERTNKEVYNRPIPNSMTLEKIKLLNKHKDTIVPHFDFIVDNPYETKEDMLETLRFIYKMPKPYRIQLFSLVFYPKTELYERAKKDGILTEENSGYKKSLAKYANLDTMDFYSFAIVYSSYIPKRIYKLFTYKPVFSILNSRIFNRFYKAGAKLAIALNRRFKLKQNILNRAA